MAEDTPQQDRTEAATPRRLQRAREEGRVPVSREVHNFAGLAAVTLVVAMAAGDTAQDLAVQLATFLAHADSARSGRRRRIGLAGTALLQGAAPYRPGGVAGGHRRPRCCRPAS